MTDRDMLLQQLSAHVGTRRRLTIDEVWVAFRQALRGFTGEARAREHLATLLQKLADEGALTLPRGRQGWDHSVAPSLPYWVQLQRPAMPPARPDHRAIAWPPELAFVTQLKSVPLLDELVAIRQFLATGGRERALVPLRERSLEIFGDEKRLDNLLKTKFFTSGQLTLDLLRCYEVAPPLVWEVAPGAHAALPILIVENLHTYDSFRRYNQTRGAYAAVAYGHGHEFKKTCLDLPRLCQLTQSKVIEYFGDIDFHGLEIPLHARKVLAARAPQLDIVPANAWYAALLTFADQAQPARPLGTQRLPPLDWFAPVLRPAMKKLLAEDRRLAQEHIGLDYLRNGA